MHPILQEIRDLDTAPRALRSFGLVVGGVLLGVAAWIGWRHGWRPAPWAYALGGAGLLLVLLGLAWPVALRLPYRAWMALAFVLGFVMTRVILTVTFCLVVVPIGLLMRLSGRDPLHRRLEPDRPSYWIPRETDEAPERLERYY